MKKEMVYGMLVIGGLYLFIVSASASNKLVQKSADPWKAPAWVDTIKNPYRAAPLSASKGEELYNIYCWSCHGETGYGDGAAGGALGVKPANFHDSKVKNQTDGALLWKMTTGRGNMPPFKEVLSEEQRWQLVSYLRELTKQ